MDQFSTKPAMNRATIAQAFITTSDFLVAGEPSLLASHDQSRAAPAVWRPVNDSLLAAVIVAELLKMPLASANAIKRVGRFIWVEFRPVNYPDPQMIIALPGPASIHFNRVAMDFWRVRERGPRDPRKWYTAARAVMLRFMPALHRMGASPEESDFVLSWASDVLIYMRQL